MGRLKAQHAHVGQVDEKRDLQGDEILAVVWLLLEKVDPLRLDARSGARLLLACRLV
jgi:hypothetical protein